jgi:hypothetical protein
VRGFISPIFTGSATTVALVQQKKKNKKQTADQLGLQSTALPPLTVEKISSHLTGLCSGLKEKKSTNFGQKNPHPGKG